MGIKIPEGYELLTGRSRENARAAIKLAEERGLPTESVRTTGEGYLIPITDEVDKADFEYIELPESTATKAEFEAFAEKHGIDLSGASNNAARFDAIQDWAQAIPEAEVTPIGDQSDDDPKEGE